MSLIINRGNLSLLLNNSFILNLHLIHEEVENEIKEKLFSQHNKTSFVLSVLPATMLHGNV